jgi:similar to stage IV sporulation protein
VKYIHLIRGELELEVTGQGLERFFNLAGQAGIVLRQVTRINPEKMRVRVSLKQVRRLRLIARQSRCRFRIRRRLGLPFLLQQVRRRFMLALGALFFLIAFYLAGNTIFVMDVVSPYEIKTEDAAEVRRIAGENGICLYRLNWLLDLEGAKLAIIEEMPELAWVNIEAKGTKLIINMVKRSDLPEEERKPGPGNIVAKMPGVIEAVLVTKGWAEVRAGDTVKAGQVLIRGVDAITQIPASGIVLAKVWAQGYGEHSLLESGWQNTGRMERQVLVCWGDDKKIMVMGNPEPSFAHWERQESLQPLVIWRKMRLPVELLTIDYHEQETYEEITETSQALQLAGEVAEQAAVRLLPAEAEIKEKYVRDLSSGDEIIRIQVTLEAQADIGLFQGVGSRN